MSAEIVPTSTQERLLKALADGAYLYEIRTGATVGAHLIHRATKTQAIGRSEAVLWTTLDRCEREGWLTNLTAQAWRWRGSQYTISRKGRRVLRDIDRRPTL